MPSRAGLATIALFWLATAGFVTYRDVLPRYLSSGPPPLRIDLADEATANESAKWSIYRRDDSGKLEKIGGATTQMEYVGADDTFWFKSEYNDFKFRFGSVLLELPQLKSNLRVTRRGALREQLLSTQIKASVGPLAFGTATADLSARVEEGVLVGTAWLASPFGKLERPLEPVPVTGGQVLNPLMPLNRLRDVRPGQRWVIRQVDPVREAVALMARQAAQGAPLPLALPGGSDEAPELVASVGDRPEPLVSYGRIDPNPPPVDCWVIDYRGGDFRARTWVQVSDGRVLRQEATGFGEQLRFERDF